jgi:hypothetical protein
VVILVGEVGALFIWRLGVGEVEGVGLPAAAHCYVGPFAVGVPGDDYEGAVGGDTLGFVSGHCVAVVAVTLFEVPRGEVPNMLAAVEANSQALLLLVDAGDGGQVAVEYFKPLLVVTA